MPSDLAPIVRQTLNQSVYAELRRALINGSLHSGQVLGIVELARNLGTDLHAEIDRKMAINRKRLVFFERWFDPVAEKILGAQDDIELVRLLYADPKADNWAELSLAVGYQISARTELREPWFGDADLLGEAEALLAEGEPLGRFEQRV